MITPFPCRGSSLPPQASPAGNGSCYRIRNIFPCLQHMSRSKCTLQSSHYCWYHSFVHIAVLIPARSYVSCIHIGTPKTVQRHHNKVRPVLQFGCISVVIQGIDSQDHILRLCLGCKIRNGNRRRISLNDVPNEYIREIFRLHHLYNFIITIEICEHLPATINLVMCLRLSASQEIKHISRKVLSLDDLIPIFRHDV